MSPFFLPSSILPVPPRLKIIADISITSCRRQCTRELLQEYYVNLAKTHTSGKFKVEDPKPSSVSSGSDNSRSRSASPVDEPMVEERVGEVKPFAIAEPSSVLMGKTISPPSSPPIRRGPTFEQNMAFEALQAAEPPAIVLRPEKRTNRHLVEQTGVDDVRVVKRKLEG